MIPQEDNKGNQLMNALQQLHSDLPPRLSTGEKWMDTKGCLWAVYQIDNGKALVRNPAYRGKRVRADPAPRGWTFVDADFAYPRLKKEIVSLLADLEHRDHDLNPLESDTEVIDFIRERLVAAVEGQS